MTEQKKTGSITKISKKDTHSSQKGITMHGENGVTMRTVGKIKIEADKINLKDHEDIKNQIPGTTVVHLGVFFDGTLNNKYNTKIRRENQSKMPKASVSDKDSSYWNDTSNIAKLFEMYERGKKEIGTNKETKTFYVPVYVEGIGTFMPEPDEGGNYFDDDMIGFMTGRGVNEVLSFDEIAIAQKAGMKTDSDTGVVGKVDLAFNKYIINAFKDPKIQVPKGNKDKNGKKVPKIDKIYIDVFGFSRGAAAARHFLNEINKDFSPAGTTTISGYDRIEGEYNDTVTHDREPPAGKLGKNLEKAGYPIGDSAIEIRFVGIYDTVPSITSDSELRIVRWGTNIAKSGIYFPNPITTPIAIITGAGTAALGERSMASGAQNDDNAPLKLSLAGIKAREIFHSIAKHEYRKNFRLSKNDGRGGDWEGYGAHSDIGGGYESDASPADIPLSMPIVRTFLGEEHKNLINMPYLDEQLYEMACMVAEGYFKKPKGYIDNYNCYETDEQKKLVEGEIRIERKITTTNVRVPRDIYKEVKEKLDNEEYYNAGKQVLELLTDATIDIGLTSDKRWKWMKQYTVTDQLIGKRQVLNDLSKVHLFTMYKRATYFKVPFVDESIVKESFKVPAELENLKKSYSAAMLGESLEALSEEERVKIINKFIHISWSYKMVKNIYIDVIKPYEPEARPIGAKSINRVRIKYSPK